ncbi:MAG: sigma 54-interacting transcriptional regulator [Gemmatimonadaceae bacterium]
MPQSSPAGLSRRQAAPASLPASGDGPTPPSARSAAFRSTLAAIERYARHPRATVLLEGETGTGKTYLASLLHTLSPRRGKPFQTVVLASLDDGLAGSDLFGHVPGAFTDARHGRVGHFVSANGGTLFLDEIGQASLTIQRKLLHAVEHKEIWPVGTDRAVRVDVRLVAASNVPLETLVERERFLPDLLPRLSAFRVRIPPLRERRADIPDLVDQFVARHASQCGYRTPPDVDPDLMEVLRRAPWPYNVRQLDAVVQRILVDAEGAAALTPAHLADDFDGPTDRVSREPDLGARIESALAATGSISGAARKLNVARSTVQRHLNRSRHTPVEALDAVEPSTIRPHERGASTVTAALQSRAATGGRRAPPKTASPESTHAGEATVPQ